MPDVTIVLPTGGRPAAFREALASALWQEGPAVEIVVYNNGADGETRAIVEAAADPRIVYVEAAGPLPIADAWERALGRASGDWVTVLADGDALVPDACAFLRHVAANVSAIPVMAWRPAELTGPGTSAAFRDLLTIPDVERPEIGQMASSADLLRDLYAWRAPLDTAPSIYGGLVHTSLVRMAQARYSRYVETTCPDAFAGLVNLNLTQMFLRLHRPLSVRGVGDGGLFQGPAEEPAPPGLFVSTVPELRQAAVLMQARDRLFPGERDLGLDVPALLRAMAAALADDTRGWEQRADAAERLAGLHGLPFDRARLARPAAATRTVAGFYRLDESRTLLVVDGAAAGIASAAAAARLTQAVSRHWR